MGTEVTIGKNLCANVVPVEDERHFKKQMERSLKKAGIKIMTNSSVERIELGAGVKAFVKSSKGEEVWKRRFYFRLLESKPILKTYGLEEVGIATDKRYNVLTIKHSGYYAIGDVT
jgi:dihydrolipoamide dehydrogenase